MRQAFDNTGKEVKVGDMMYHVNGYDPRECIGIGVDNAITIDILGTPVAVPAENYNAVTPES